MAYRIAFSNSPDQISKGSSDGTVKSDQSYRAVGAAVLGKGKSLLPKIRLNLGPAPVPDIGRKPTGVKGRLPSDGAPCPSKSVGTHESASPGSSLTFEPARKGGDSANAFSPVGVT